MQGKTVCPERVWWPIVALGFASVALFCRLLMPLAAEEEMLPGTIKWESLDQGPRRACDFVHESNVAYWTIKKRRSLKNVWAVGGEKLRWRWEKMWGEMPTLRDWWDFDDIFLEYLQARLPVGSHCLQFGPGRSKVTDVISSTGAIASLFNIDISEQIVMELKQRHKGTQNQKTRLGFEVMDGFNLRFADFEKLGWGQRFDVVFEKAGLFDIHRKSVFHMQRVLACIVTEVFQPAVGGLLIAVVDEKVDAKSETCARCADGDEQCVPCPVLQYGLQEVMAARPDFNCRIIEDIAVYPRTLNEAHRTVKVVVVRCAGVSQEYALAGCDAVWEQSCD